jgi:hypothetical protein
MWREPLKVRGVVFDLQHHHCYNTDGQLADEATLCLETWWAWAA